MRKGRKEGRMEGGFEQVEGGRNKIWRERKRRRDGEREHGQTDGRGRRSKIFVSLPVSYFLVHAFLSIFSSLTRLL